MWSSCHHGLHLSDSLSRFYDCCYGNGRRKRKKPPFVEFLPSSVALTTSKLKVPVLPSSPEGCVTEVLIGADCIVIEIVISLTSDWLLLTLLLEIGQFTTKTRQLLSRSMGRYITTNS